MDERVQECLQDILDQAKEVLEFTKEMSCESYLSDRKTQAAVERKFEIMGEALNQIHSADGELLEKIRDYRDIISFRNILAHGYDSIDNLVVWGVIENDLNGLIDDVTALL